MRALARRMLDALPPVRRLRRAVAVREETIESLKRNLAEAMRERDAYCGHMMRLENERKQCAALYEGAEQAREEMQAHAERLNAEREELIGAVSALQAELEAAHRKLEDAGREMESLFNQRNVLEQERNELKAYLERDQAAIAVLQTLVVRAGAEVPVAFPNGHFYSPVVDPRDQRVSALLRKGARISPHWLEQANGPMRALYERLGRHREAISFLGSGRYRGLNPQFWPGDAWVLAALILEFRPKRVIEVGCGHSSCVLIDINERLRQSDPLEVTFIDPHPETLYGLIGEDDRWRSRVLARRLEEVDSTLFDSLERNDILFLDTSHVVKTGGEVAYALNEVLPRLKEGVLVHIHDIFAGWEYPADWVLEDHRSWNEIYMVRLLAEQGKGWRVEMFNDLCAKVWGVEEVAGSSLWLRKIE